MASQAEVGYETFIQNKLAVDERILRKLISNYFEIINKHGLNRANTHSTPVKSDSNSPTTAEKTRDEIDTVLLEILSFKHSIFRCSKIYQNEVLTLKKNQGNKDLLEKEDYESLHRIEELNEILENEILIRSQKNQYDQIAVEINKLETKEKSKGDIINLMAEIEALEKEETLNANFISALQTQFLSCVDQLNKLNRVVELAKTQSPQSLEFIYSIICSSSDTPDNKMVIDENPSDDEQTQLQSAETSELTHTQEQQPPPTLDASDSSVSDSKNVPEYNHILPKADALKIFKPESGKSVPSFHTSADSEMKENISDDDESGSPNAFDDYDEDDSSNSTDLFSESGIINENNDDSMLSDGEVGEED